MPKLTSQQLLQARRAREAERKAAYRRELEEKEAMVRKRQEEFENATRERDRLLTLQSVVGALYLEVDKLAKKGPIVPISQLTLNRVNKVITSVKEFVAPDKDEFVDDIVEFVAAGDMPEYRDVALVPSQVNKGVGKTGTKWESVNSVPHQGFQS